MSSEFEAAAHLCEYQQHRTGKRLYIQSQRVRLLKIRINSVFTVPAALQSWCLAHVQKKALQINRWTFRKKLVLVEAGLRHLSPRTRAADRQAHSGVWSSHSVAPPIKHIYSSSCPIRILDHWLLPIPLTQTHLSLLLLLVGIFPPLISDNTFFLNVSSTVSKRKPCRYKILKY